MVHPSRRGVPLHDLRAVPPGLRAIAWTCRLEREVRACGPVAAAAAPTTADEPAVPLPAVAAHAAAAAGAPEEGEAGTGLPLEELLALEALAEQAAPADEFPASEDEGGFGGFDD